MWRKPVGDGAKRVTTGVFMSKNRSHSGNLVWPLYKARRRVSRHYCSGRLPPSLTCGNRRPYSKIGPLRVLRVWAGSHRGVFGKVRHPDVISEPTTNDTGTQLL